MIFLEAFQLPLLFLAPILLFLTTAAAECTLEPKTNLIINPGFEDNKTAGNPLLYPWSVENGCDGDARRSLSKRRCPPSGTRISPGDNSSYALQGYLNSPFGNGPDMRCKGSSDVVQTFDGACPGELYSLTYRYRIPLESKPEGKLVLSTRVGDFFSTIPVVPNDSWQTFEAVPFTNQLYKDNLRAYDEPLNSSQLEVYLTQTCKCKVYNYNAVLQLDNFAILPAARKKVARGASNLVSNSGFESGSLAPWTLNSNVPQAGVVSPGEDSKFAFMHTGLNDSVYAHSAISQMVSLEPNKTYIVRLDYLSRNQTTQTRNEFDYNVIEIALGDVRYTIDLNNYETKQRVNVWHFWDRSIVARSAKEELKISFATQYGPVNDHQILVDNIEVSEANKGGQESN